MGCQGAQITKHDKKKRDYLSAAAFLIAASYAILRPFKISIFFQIVGKQYYPLSKFFLVLVAIPAIACYSKLVDRHKRHHILYILFTLYSLACILFTLLLSHPVWGIANTSASPYRLLGWMYTIAMDFYPTFVLGTFWAFINSISTDTFAKNNYGFIMAFVKAGSLGATIASFLLMNQTKNVYLLPVMISVASLFLASSLFFIKKIYAKIPKDNLDGYRANTDHGSTPHKNKIGVLEGLKLMITTPYVFGIFLLFYFYDVIFVSVEYFTTVQLSATVQDNAHHMSSLLYLSALISHITGIIIVTLITPRVLRSIKLKHSLLIMPAFTTLIIFTLLLFPVLPVMVMAMALLPALHFSLNSPVREILFIPTIKEIQFKSKAWIDSFGRTLSKTSGSSASLFFYSAGLPWFLALNTAFSLALITFWSISAYFMGKKCQETIDKKEIIGIIEENKPNS